MLKTFLSYLIFPGFLFSACAGLIACWIDRKVTARIQWRVGPPWHQNFTDIIKLLGKETIVPSDSSKWTFLLAPCLGVLGLILATTIIGRAALVPQESFLGDLIVVLYLLIIPAVAMIIAGASSGNPLASVGVSREMKLVLAYELPFLLSVTAVIIKCNGAIQFAGILNHQLNFASNIASFPGILAFVAALICMQAKLGLAPFDISEADQELMGGVLIEYSGLPLALFKLTKAMLLYTSPLLLIVLFFGKDLSLLFILLKFVGILVVFILIKNTNPRLRIDQALRFFWGPVTLLALLANGLALLGY